MSHFSILLLFAIALASFSALRGQQCPAICNSTPLIGFAAGGVPGCTCVKPGSPSNGCECGACFVPSSEGVYGYTYQPDGTCPFKGTDCSKCTKVGKEPVKPEPEKPPPSIEPAAANTTNTSTNSQNDSDREKAPSKEPATPSAPGPPPSSQENTSKKDVKVDTITPLNTQPPRARGLAMWQIIVIICCCTMGFIVVMVAILSCYCRARKRLVANEAAEDDADFYRYNYDLPRTVTPAVIKSSMMNGHGYNVLNREQRGSCSGSTTSAAVSGRQISRRGSSDGPAGLEVFESASDRHTALLSVREYKQPDPTKQNYNSEQKAGNNESSKGQHVMIDL